MTTIGKCHRVHLTGTVRVPLETKEALELFTPTGERTWVAGWNPAFPAEMIAGETQPGTIFATDHQGAMTTWIVIRYQPGELVEYARFAAGDRAGLVRVQCSTSGDGSTTATVSYDLTALQPDANTSLEAFADGFAQFLAGWQDAIEKAISPP